jgi:hypothetical protein
MLVQNATRRPASLLALSSDNDRLCQAAGTPCPSKAYSAALQAAASLLAELWELVCDSRSPVETRARMARRGGFELLLKCVCHDTGSHHVRLAILECADNGEARG